MSVKEAVIGGVVALGILGAGSYGGVKTYNYFKPAPVVAPVAKPTTVVKKPIEKAVPKRAKAKKKVDPICVQVKRNKDKVSPETMATVAASRGANYNKALAKIKACL